MATGDHDRACDLFLRAVDLPENECEALLELECAGDAALRAEVEGLIDADRKARDMPELNPGAAPDPTAAPPQRIGPYRIIEEIGSGGMGVVYRSVREEGVRLQVALKLIKLGMDTRQVIARFEAERQALALMSHGNIARVLDAGSTPEGRPFFVMEHVDGVPLDVYCGEHRLTIEDRLRLFIDICLGIQHAHQKGIVHRDLKPSNVLVCEQDGKAVPKIIDFGVAKATEEPLTEASLHTRAGAMIGTPGYMSPEQIAGTSVDTRSDIYALGVMLYRMLTGSLPFGGSATPVADEELRRRILQDTPQRPSERLIQGGEREQTLAGEVGRRVGEIARELRGDLDWIVVQAMSREPERRYASAEGMARDLTRYLEGDPVEARPPSRRYRLGKFLRKHKAGVSLAALALLVIVGAGAAAVWVTTKSVYAQRQSEVSQLLVQSQQFSGDDRWDEARPLAEKAVQVAPWFCAAWINLGQIRLKSGDYPAAVQAMEAACECDPKRMAYRMQLAVLHEDAGEQQNAADEYARILELAPDFTEARSNYGASLLRLGRPAEAEVELRQSIQRKETPTDRSNLGTALYFLAAAKRQEGDEGRAGELIADAIAQYRHAVRLEEDYAVHRSNLGDALAFAGDPEGARAAYCDAARIAEVDMARAPSNPRETMQVALNTAQCNIDPQRADVLARAAVDSSPQMWSLRAKRAKVLALIGSDRQTILEAIDQALERGAPSSSFDGAPEFQSLWSDPAFLRRVRAP